MANHHDKYNKRQKSRRDKRIFKRIIVLLFSVAVILVLAWLATEVIQKSSSENEGRNPPLASSSTFSENASSATSENVSSATSESFSSSSLAISSASLPATSDIIDPATWNFVGPLQQEGEQMQIFEPDYRMFSVPENGRIDMEYFKTVTFVGDSITQGLFIYPSYGFPDANYCAYLGASPKSIYDGSMLNRHKNLGGGTEVPLESLVASQPDNVYILMGTNALVSRNLTDEDFIAYYREMIIQIQAVLDPSVGVYVQSITPVIQDGDVRFDMARIKGLNNQLAKTAWELGVNFIDLNEVLAGDDGFLRAEYGAKDGYHLKPEGYGAWREYLITHTVYHRRHAQLYLEKSSPQA